VTDVIDELHRRGLIAQTTDEEALRAHLAAGPVTYYCGFDPTAPSLHVGHLVQFMVLRALQRAGHRPIVLVGGATGLIGDPRPSAERQLNDRATVAGWVDSIRRQVAPFLDLPAEREGLAAPVYVDNLTWTEPLSAIDFLRDLGKHFRVGRMLAKEAVSARLNSEAGISYTEFSYQILQANDFRELHRRHGCTLQSGGSDQWGNLTAGIDLVRRTEGATVHALSTQLVTKSDGTKFGKSEGGSVWLDPRSPRPTPSSSSGSTPTTPTPAPGCRCSPSARPRRCRPSSPRAPSAPPPGRRSAPSPRSSRCWYTAPRSCGRPRPPGAPCSAGRT
jgi:tyrosyl-tRNA synthetase